MIVEDDESNGSNVTPPVNRPSHARRPRVHGNGMWWFILFILSSLFVGYHKKGYQNQRNKNRKKEIRRIIRDHQGSGAGSVSPDPLASGASSGSPDPLSSGASSASPDPSWARVQTPPHLSSHLGARLPAHDGRTLDVTFVLTSMLRQGMAVTIPTTPATVKPYLSHCEVPPHSKRGMEEINLCHCGCLFLLL